MIRALPFSSLTLLAAIQPVCAEPVSAEAAAFFETKVRPVLAEHCHKCHGPDKQVNGLRLDTKTGALKGSSYGAVLVAGKPEESKLLKAIRHEAGAEPMPKDGAKLSDAQIADIAEWVRMGLPWPESAGSAAPETWRSHWAFQPVRIPERPAVREPQKVLRGLDSFVLSALEQKGLTFSPPAPRAVLIRRAYLDLVGFPPDFETTQKFVNDPAPDAWEKVIDGLLASPHFGERWARRWMDIARYADTKGYVFQEERRYAYAYTYRDWLIRAFNADMPYDEFLQKQIAADRMVDWQKAPADLAAMGFLTLGRRFLNNQSDIIDDRLDVVFRGTQALTVACARCHDHKSDPIPTADYYSLYGVFASSREPDDKPVLGEPERTPEYIAFEKEAQAKQSAIDAWLQDRLDELFTAESVAKYLTALPEFRDKNPEDQRRMAKDKGLSPAAVQRWVAVAKSAAPDDAVFRLWNAVAVLSPEKFEQESVALVTKEPATQLRDEWLKSNPKNFAEACSVFARVITSPAAAGQPEFSRAITTQDGIRGLKIEEIERGLTRPQREHLNGLKKDLEAFRAKNPAAPPRAMVMVDTDKPNEPVIFIRGNPGRHGPRVPRQFLECLTPPGQRQPYADGSGRLELARNIGSRENPLTARVFVNRVWGYLFGRHLTESPGDFGVRTPRPSHPELIDYLAGTFMDQKWSVKTLLKRIMLSAAYQQTSALTPDAGQATKTDPENRLYWRQSPRRLDFEALRDSLLRVSGNIDHTMFGQPVPVHDGGSNRRTVYGFIDRQNLPGLFRVFDFASPDQTAPRRFETTVPQQALYLMNNPFVQEQARKLIRDIGSSPESSVEERIRQLHRRILGRDPSADELSMATEYFTRNQHARQTGTAWQNGWGHFDAATGQTVFHPLPYWNAERKMWSGGPEVPDKNLGWCTLNPGGGHPGNDSAHAVIRRWTAEEAVTLQISSRVELPSEKSNGIKALIISSRHGLVAEKLFPGKSSADLSPASVPLQPGDTLDFILDHAGDPAFDSFTWSITLTDTTNRTELAHSERDFGGPGLGIWETYAQALLCSNEFLFAE